MEGPGVRAIAGRLAPLVGRWLTSFEGRSRFPLEGLTGVPLTRVYPVGKLLFLAFPPGTLRVHFLMWGRYRLDEEIQGKSPKLTLTFDDGSTLRFYASAISLLSPEEAALHDPSLDPMDPGWDLEKAVRLVRGKGRELVCDSLMDQSILPGVGNVIKNEALFAAGVHPESPSGCIPVNTMRILLSAVRDFAFTWYRCDQEGERIQPHLRIYRKKACPGCGGEVKLGRIGALGRLSFWCPSCQTMYRCRQRSHPR